jgi:hypothetical protein
MGGKAAPQKIDTQYAEGKRYQTEQREGQHHHSVFRKHSFISTILFDHCLSLLNACLDPGIRLKIPICRFL